jgi:hypothetical protein
MVGLNKASTVFYCEKACIFLSQLARAPVGQIGNGENSTKKKGPVNTGPFLMLSLIPTLSLKGRDGKGLN